MHNLIFQNNIRKKIFSRMMMGGWKVIVGGLCLAFMVQVANADDLKKRYEKAIEYLPWEIGKYVSNMELNPHWDGKGSSFWYEEERADGSHFFRVTPKTGKKVKLAAKPHSVKGKTYPAGMSISPNGQWGIEALDGNLFAHPLKGGNVRQLTFDAEIDYQYSVAPESDLYAITKKIHKTPPQVNGTWSPDGHKFLTYRVDERKMYKMPYVVSITGGRASNALCFNTKHIFPRG